MSTIVGVKMMFGLAEQMGSHLLVFDFHSTMFMLSYPVVFIFSI